jgi:hypothetical protein
MSIFLRIIVPALFLACLILTVAVYCGWAVVTFQAKWIVDPAALAYRHLRLSIIPFGILFVAYICLMARMRRLLTMEKPSLSSLAFTDRLLGAVIGTFFGVGVIWTAVGMETALLQALQGITDENSHSLTALDLLDRLVNGGLLLALSTTIFGGICGYGLRMIKIVVLGSSWDRAVLQAGEAGA